MTVNITINGIQRRLPIIRLDGRDYFIMGGTYQRLYHEKIINERYTSTGAIKRQIVNTRKIRWRMTLMVPTSYTQVTVTGGTFNVGDIDTLHASANKMPPNDLLAYYDITAYQNFAGSYTHYVYLKLDWEQPNANDPGVWQVPIELWGYENA